MNEQNKARVFFLQRDQEGRAFGSGEWDGGLMLYLSNIRTKGNKTVANVDYKTNESYINKAGKTCFKHAVCGMLAFDADEAKMIVELAEGQKTTVTCTPRKVNSKKTGRPMVVLDFSKNIEQNPYEDELLGADNPF